MDKAERVSTVLGFLEKTKLYRDAQKAIDSLWDLIKKLFSLKDDPKNFVALVVLVLILVVVTFVSKRLSSNPSQGDVIGESTNSNIVNIDGDNNTVNINPRGSGTESPSSSNFENCYTEWIPFTSKHWEGLNSGFEEANGVFTLPDKKKLVDSVAFYVKPCKASIKADLEFISYADKLINMDIYYGNWFRWEIGGRDLNSVKLYKNLEGCTAFKYAVPVDTDSKYLPDGLKLPTGQPTKASVLVFLTGGGRLRTELHLEFISESGEKILIDDKFYYEFDVSWKCDEKTVLDIDNDTQRIGVGLMRSYIENDELPYVRLDKFKVQKYQVEE